MIQFDEQIIGGKRKQVYVIDDNVVYVDNIVWDILPQKSGYPYNASVFINNNVCGVLHNYADGSASTIYSTSIEYKDMLFSVMKNIREKDKVNRNLERVCDILIERARS